MGFRWQIRGSPCAAGGNVATRRNRASRPRFIPWRLLLITALVTSINLRTREMHLANSGALSPIMEIPPARIFGEGRASALWAPPSSRCMYDVLNYRMDIQWGVKTAPAYLSNPLVPEMVTLRAAYDRARWAGSMPIPPNRSSFRNTP